ncbi:hypothetical protein ACOMHN_032584 [Nucella lapillus]
MPVLVVLTALLSLLSPVTSREITSADDAGTMASPSVQLSPGQPREFSIPDFNVTTLTVTGVSPTSSFIVVQVHTQHAILLLTQTSPPPAVGESGTSVGMVQAMKGQGLGEMRWAVGVVKGSVVGGDDDFPVPVLATVQEYAENVPVPGGCNQVFALEVDPNIRVTSADYNSQVWFQWANVGTAPGGVLPGCEEKAYERRLEYEVYVAYTGELDDRVSGLFDTVRSMASVQKIRSNAVKVKMIENDGRQKSLVKLNSQRGQGSVYGVIVTDTHQGLSASYVSAVSYACNYTAGECSLQCGALEWVMMVACGTTGLILLILGHNFIKTEMVVMGFIAVTLVSFILLSLSHTLSAEVRLGVAGTLGVLGGVGWLALWVAFTFPSISVLLPGLCAGFLVASALFFTPFANISWWASSLNYGLVFTCVALLFGVMFLYSPRTLNIVSCSLVGGYCVTMIVAIPLRSSVRLMVMNVVRHAAVPQYASALMVSPFLANDIILTVVWMVLTCLAMGWQFYRARGRPHFPLLLRQPCRPRRVIYTQGQGQREGRGHRQPPDDNDDERAPLLGNRPPPPFYQDSVNHPPSTPETNCPM